MKNTVHQCLGSNMEQRQTSVVIVLEGSKSTTWIDLQPDFIPSTHDWTTRHGQTDAAAQELATTMHRTDKQGGRFACYRGQSGFLSFQGSIPLPPIMPVRVPTNPITVLLLPLRILTTTCRNYTLKQGGISDGHHACW